MFKSQALTLTGNIALAQVQPTATYKSYGNKIDHKHHNIIRTYSTVTTTYTSSFGVSDFLNFLQSYNQLFTVSIQYISFIIVDAMNTRSEFVSVVPLSALDQAMSKLYVRHFLCFPYDDKQDKNQTISLLRIGLKRTVKSLPFLTATVVPVDAIKKGWVELGPVGPEVEFIVKDFTNSLQWTKTYAELDAQNMPNSELDGDLLAPCDQWPKPGDRKPVIAVQLNFIQGGLIICLCPHHSVLDAVAFGTFWQLWAQNCREALEPGGGVEGLVLSRAWVDKSSLMQIPSDPPVPNSIYNQFMNRYPKEPSPAPARRQPAKSVIFHFSAASLTKLQDKISSSKIVVGTTTTMQALSALLWCCICDVRHQRHLSEGMADPYARSTLGVAVDVRSRLHPPLPSTFLGNAIVYLEIHRQMAPEDPPTDAMARAGWEIRQALTQIDDPHIRSIIRYIEIHRDTNELAREFFPHNPETDLTISSWACLPLYDLDWGRAIASKPAYVRLPRGDVNYFCIILPRLPDRSLEVLLSLGEEDMVRLQKHEMLMEYAMVRCEGG